MNADQCLALHFLRREVMSTRSRGRVIVEFDDGVGELDEAMARQATDSMLVLVNLPRLGRHAWMIDHARAAEVISAIMQWDLVTQQPLADEATAQATAEKLLAEVGEGAMFLTNIRPSSDLRQPPHRWVAESQPNQRDAGLTMISADLTGLVWVMDRG